MAKVTIDALGVEIPLGGSLGKHLQAGFGLVDPGGEAAALKASLDGRIGAASFEKTRFGFKFKDDVSVNGGELTFEAGASSGISLFGTGKTVLKGEDFGPKGALTAGANRAVLGVDFTAKIGGQQALDDGDLSFLFGANKEVRFANYRSFTNSTKLRTAITRTFEDFHTPTDMEGLREMLDDLPKDSALSMTGEGALKFSGKLAVSSTGAPLATVDLPLTDQELKVVPSAEISLGVSAEISSRHELRIITLSKNRFSLGYFNRDAEELEVTVSAKAGADVEIGGKDFLQKVVDATSSQPKVDKAFLKDLKLPAERVKLLEDTVKAAFDTQLEGSLDLALRSLSADEAAFLFTVDLSKLDEDGERAVEAALAGDLSQIAGEEIAGVTVKRSVFRKLKERQYTLKINLFGIFNFVSIGEFLEKSEMFRDNETGELLIVDSAEVRRRGALLKQKKIAKLRAESALLTAAYAVCRGIQDGPELELDYWYFRYRKDTSRSRMKDLLDVPVALGLLKEGKIAEELGEGIEEYGRSAISIESQYEKARLLALFVKGEKRRTADDYVEIGREALGRLVREGDKNESIRLLVTDDGLWNALDANPARDLEILEERGIKGASPYYRAITGWANAMEDLSEAVAEVTAYIEEKAGVRVLIKGPATKPEIKDAKFKDLRKKLKKKMKSAAGKVKATFGEPWGVVAMDLAGGREGEASVRIVSDELRSKVFERKAAATGAAA